MGTIKGAKESKPYYPLYYLSMQEETRKKREYYSSKKVQKHLRWIRRNLITQSRLLEKYKGS